MKELRSYDPHSIFHSETILSTQWIDLYAKRKLTPEERLVAAILSSAWDDIGGPSSLHAHNTKAWLEEDEGPVPYFTGCCDVFGWPPDTVRRLFIARYNLERWRISERPKWVSAESMANTIRTAALNRNGTYTARSLGRLPELEGLPLHCLHKELTKLRIQGKIERLNHGLYRVAV